MPIPAIIFDSFDWTNFDDSDDSLIKEYPYYVAIKMLCAHCSECICYFKNAHSENRLIWRLPVNDIQWNVEFTLLNNRSREIMCECLNVIGYVRDEDTWLLIKKNVEINH